MKNNIFNYTLIFSLAAITFLSSCGGSSKERRFIKKPTDALITKMASVPEYSIILNDMDVVGDDQFRHKYQIVKTVDTTVTEEITDWLEVPEDYFWKNEENLGMALVTKNEDGTINKVASPPGYDNYVGNEKYGQWKTDNSGNSFWSFYGRYLFMSHMFGMIRRPVYYSGYSTYNSNYRGSRPYYGSSSNPRYGTKSSYAKKSNPSFFSRRSKSTGWTSSSSKYKSSGGSSSKYSGSGTSKYSSSKSTRGFGGGFGK